MDMKGLFRPLLIKALRHLARATLAMHKPEIIGITGNVGKTSTKEAIRALLRSEKHVRVPRETFNTEFGLPLTILGDWGYTGGVWFWICALFVGTLRLVIRDHSYPKIIVLEYGIDTPGDMDYLLSIAQPTTGVLTAIGEVPVHVGFFENPEELAQEKKKLLRALPEESTMIISADDKRAISAKDEIKRPTITFGFNERANMRIKEFKTKRTGRDAELHTTLLHDGKEIVIVTKGSIGKSHAISISAAAAVGITRGMKLEAIKEDLTHYRAPKSRLNILPGIKESMIIDDTYNSSPIALTEALNALNDLADGRKVVVLGDMLELGKFEHDAHVTAGKEVKECADILITLGRGGKIISDTAVENGLQKGNVNNFMDIRSVTSFLSKMIRDHDTVLIKGSQSVRMEKIVEAVMEEPKRASELLVRQSESWKKRHGLYG
jgi:UDP-N-acetylmuramoyl-tripeptide--D-alanyl-D-alanine ligase